MLSVDSEVAEKYLNVIYYVPRYLLQNLGYYFNKNICPCFFSSSKSLANCSNQNFLTETVFTSAIIKAEFAVIGTYVQEQISFPKNFC